MMNSPTLNEVLLTGDSSYIPKQEKLRAGPLSVVYENGTIRYIKYRDWEVIRMINSAVRDHNWDTVPGTILKQDFRVEENEFVLHLYMDYKSADVHFEAEYIIAGAPSGEITFTMNGRALRSFRKNRIGFCVMHPVNECVGRPCEVFHTDDEITQGVFPVQISPHQPFMDMSGIRWSLPDGSTFRLDFEGDTFEMEDQRNWTDASYKIYCTPLGIPFPVEMSKGQEVCQVIRLTPENLVPTDSAHQEKGTELKILWDEKTVFPAIGTCVSSEVDSLSLNDLSKIREVGFNHIRIDVKLFESWRERFIKEIQNHQSLGLPYELALHLTEEDPEASTREIAEVMAGNYEISSIILYQHGTKVITDRLLARVVPLLRKIFPGVRIGGGTNAYFTELNRERVTPELLDFVTFSINPQVHAFDNSSLVETLEAQGYVVDNTKEIFDDKDVHVSPITLKPRFNPNATGSEPPVPHGELAPQVDIRQMSTFGAGWTVGSIKYLSEGGAKSVSLFETVGMQGLFLSDSENPHPIFPAKKGKIFPVYAVLKDILTYSAKYTVKSKSSCPLEVDGIVLSNGNSVRIFLVNYLTTETTVNIPGLQGRVTIRKMVIDLEENRFFGTTVIDKAVDGLLGVDINGYGITILDVSI